MVVSFHSLEDKIIKDFFNQHSGKKTTISRYQPQKNIAEVHEFIVPKKLPIIPTQSELTANPRSRSAKLRWGEKI